MGNKSTYQIPKPFPGIGGGKLTCYKSADYVFASDAFGLKAPGFSRIYYQINNNMITQPKEQYTSPKCEELEVNLEGVIAASAPEYEDGGLLS